MTVTSYISVSLDGYVAGPDQNPEQPLGTDGERLHDWAIASEAWRSQHGHEGGTTGADSDIVARSMEGVGAFIMGRKMFDGGSGPLDPEWKGWWGENPPYHAPVFVLTHREREPLEMEGGTTFTFVNDGIESALEQATAASGGQDVSVIGGGSAIAQYLAAGLLDVLHLHIAPILLGGGSPLFAEAGRPVLEPVEAVHSPAVTHVTYRVVH